MQKQHLDKDEFIELDIFHKKHLPFRLEDWLRLIISIGFIIAGIASIRSDGFISIGTVLILVAIFFIYLPLLLRWIRLKPLKYLITNKRLIVYDSIRNTIKHSFDFNSFPEIKMHENAYNSGFIIVGEAQETFVRGRGLHSMRYGVNLVDHEIVLENIPNVRKTYQLLKDKIELNTHNSCQAPAQDLSSLKRLI